MLSKADRRNIAVNLWTAKVIPFVLAGAAGYATYVLVALLCIQYLLNKHDAKGVVISILVTYFTLLFFMATCFLRLVYITTVSPPYLPLGDTPIRRRGGNKKRRTSRSKHIGIAGKEYDGGNSSQDTEKSRNTRADPDSPGLELFYTKDVFICGNDGRPKFCSECQQWKNDRTHHCSSAGRCILKMDHFCPWVGGPIGESNFKFFLQFTGWSALYCAHLMTVMAYYVHKQLSTETEPLNSQFAAVLALSAFFGLFTAGMTGTSIDLVLRNLTQVEKLSLPTRVHILAVHKPHSGALLNESGEIEPQAEELPYLEVTYPLEIDQNSGNPNNTHFRATRDQHPDTETAQSVVNASIKAHDPEKANADAVFDNSAIRSDVVDLPMSPVQALPAQTERQGDPSNERLGKVLSRDTKATRRFAILRAEPGVNVWDLGSPLLNWRTVMGTNVIDWVLPIRRSPCCNHEDLRSQFALGPAVDSLCRSYGLRAPKRSGSGKHHGDRQRSRRRSNAEKST